MLRYNGRNLFLDSWPQGRRCKFKVVLQEEHFYLNTRCIFSPVHKPSLNLRVPATKAQIFTGNIKLFLFVMGID